MLSNRHFAAFFLALFILTSCPLFAQGGYRKPPKDIVRILDAPPVPGVSVDPTGERILLMKRESLPSVADMAQPMLRLAGNRVNPRTNGRHGPRRYVGLGIRALSGGAETELVLPPDANVGSAGWSPDGKRVVFTITTDDGIHLWVADGQTGKAARIGGQSLNAAMGSAFSWIDGGRLLCRFVPEGRGDAPSRPLAPIGPVIRESAGRTAPVRTYQDLLQDAHDEDLFEFHMTSQLGVVNLETGTVSSLGEPAVFSGASASPDGRHFLVTRLDRPYSQLVTSRSFASRTEVWNVEGELVKRVASRPIQDEVPIGGVSLGRRRVGWHATLPAVLVWAEALDGGDPKAEVPHRDRVMWWDIGGAKEPREVMKTQFRFSGVAWLETGTGGLVSTSDRPSRQSRTWLVPFVPGEDPRLLFDLSSEDVYGNPGRPLSRRTPLGRSTVRISEGCVLLSGSGSSPEGDRPFLDRMHLTSMKTERLWRCEKGCYESVVEVLSAADGLLLTRYESPSDPPNYRLRNIKKDSSRAITAFEDPAPELKGISKQLVRYTRDDGIALSATLYLPAGYRKGERLPLVVWAYPREYKNPKLAGQVRGSPYRHTRIGGTSHLFFLTQGYAVLDGAAMPVVGDAKTANNTFIEQIVASARAAIDTAVEMGVADRNRVGVGGHSYGAFMTANLLAHSDLFKAGIARSGAYNRTLTPFGFQNERRTFWEAPDIYFRMSPFMHADKLKEPILLIHGKDDNNSGTFPIQSERFYHALKGHGGNVRLCMLPNESHGYRGRESSMHALAEMIEWFDKHVKGAAQ